MKEICLTYDGMSFIDFILTYKGDVEYLFDTLSEMKYTTNETYLIDFNPSYRVEITNNYLDKPIISNIDISNLIVN